MTKPLPPAPRITVNVTQFIIDQAVPRDSGHCMIADGVVSSYPGAVRASADMQTIRFSDPDKGLRYVYLTPRLVMEALVRFDLGQAIEPFSFQLRAGHTTRVSHRDPVTGRVTRKPAGRPFGTGQPNPMAPSDGDAKTLTTRKNDGRLPVPSGGKPEPMGALASGTGVPRNRRRAFGARQMDKFR